MQNGSIEKLENIPQELRPGNNWVNYRAVIKDNGKTDKIPLSPNTLKDSASTRPHEWGSYITAISRIRNHPEIVAGMGRMMAPGETLCGIDLDDCVTDGVINEEATKVIKLFNSYTEISPSKTGVRIFVYGQRAEGNYYKKNPNNGMECYDRARFLTTTGDCLDFVSHNVEHRQDEINEFLERWMKKPDKPQSNNTPHEPSPFDVSVDDLLTVASEAENGPKFMALWNGEWESLKEYTSQSEADLALVAEIKFYCPSFEEVDYFFRESEHIDDDHKWIKREDYRRSTYEAATCSETYNGWKTFFDAKFHMSAERANDMVTPLEVEAAPQVYDEPMDDEPDDGPTPKKPTDYTKPYSFNPITTDVLLNTKYKREQLIEKMLVKGQPGIIGGPSKTLKTSIMIDMAVSLGSGTPFLGVYPTKKVKTILISGESGEETIQETIRRVARGRFTPDGIDVLWGFELPRLSNDEDMAVFVAGLKAHKVEVAIIDPLYLCLLNGAENVNAANLYDMGPLLQKISVACLSVGCTPLLVHHSKKFTKLAPMDLDDLAFAGVTNFMRQWVMISRREHYQSDGEHKLFFKWGGSAGHTGLKGLDISEGVIDENFEGRTWNVKLLSIDEANNQQKEAKAEAKGEKVQKLVDEFLEGVKETEPITVGKLATHLDWTVYTTKNVRDRCERMGIIQVNPGHIIGGHGAQIKAQLITLQH